MTQRTYLRLPVHADEGFPQAFRLSFNSRVYQLLFYVNILETEEEPPDTRIYTLPDEGAFMVMRVARETAGAPAVIFQRKLVSGLEYEAAELAFLFTEMVVAKSNLNGAGAFGSRVVGGIAAR